MDQTGKYQLDVETRDGRVSFASDATNLPGFRDSVDVQKQSLQPKV
jgi:hypothetical protein